MEIDSSLDCILCTKERRKLDSGSAFSYRGRCYQLLSGGKVAPTIPRSAVTVLSSKRIWIKAECNGKVYSVKRLEARPKTDMKIKARKKRVYGRVPASHPWKSGYAASQSYDKTGRKTLEGLLNSTLAWNPNNQ